MTMNWFKTIVWGVGLFLVHFVIGGITQFGLKLEGTPAITIMLVSNAILVFLCAWFFMKIPSLGHGLGIGLIWSVIYGLLDYLVIVQILLKGDVQAYAAQISMVSMVIGYGSKILIPAILGSFPRSEK